MELLEALEIRKSIRAFKTDPVPRALLTEIIEVARWSPSWGNTQPWELVVVEGEKVKQLTDELVAAYEKMIPLNPDVPMPATLYPHCANLSKMCPYASNIKTVEVRYRED